MAITEFGRVFRLNGHRSSPERPLSENFRHALRTRGVLPNRIRLRTDATSNLTEELARAIGDGHSRLAALVWSDEERIALETALGAVEDVMAAQWQYRRRQQFLPVRVSLLHLMDHADSPTQTLSAIARAAERQAQEELLKQIELSVGDPALLSKFKDRLNQPIQEQQLRAELNQLISKSEGSVGNGDQYASVLWSGLQIRANRVVNDPAPWFVHELQRETSQLMAVMEAHQIQSRGRIRTLENALDGVLGLTAGLVSGAALYPYTSSLVAIGAGLTIGGAVSLLRMRVATQMQGDTEAVDVPASSRSQDTASFQRVPSDAIEVGAQFAEYLSALRELGLVPVLLFEQASAMPMQGRQLSAWLRNLIAMVPDGVPSLFVSNDIHAFDGVPEVSETYRIRPEFDDLHRWIEARLRSSHFFTSSDSFRLRTNEAAIRYAMLASCQSDVGKIESMLQERKIAGRRVPAANIKDGLVLRIRTTFQLASEVVLRRFKDEMANRDDVGPLLGLVLQTLLHQWEMGDSVQTDETTVSRYVDAMPNHWIWSRLDTAMQQKLLSALSHLIELLSNRAWLISRLSHDASLYADLVPEWPILMKRDDVWTWSFANDGQPLFDVGRDADLTEPPAVKPDMSAMTQLVSTGNGTHLSQSMRPKQPTLEEVLEQYLGDYTPARVETHKPAPESVVTAPPRAVSVPATEAPLSEVSTVEMLEALDAVFMDLLDGSLSMETFAKIGLLPIIPSPEVIRRALVDEPTPVSTYLVYEAGIRVRERIGVIEKFVLWVVAVRGLCRTTPTPTLNQIAGLVAEARGIRAKSAAEQHAMLPLRELKAQLRALCPSTRDLPKLFSKMALPAMTAEGLGSWGDDLATRCEALTRALREGVSGSTLATLSCDSFHDRLAAQVLDSETRMAKVAELIAYLEGHGPAHDCDWLAGSMTAAQMSQIYLHGITANTEMTVWSARALASIGLGLNDEGYCVLGGPTSEQLSASVAEKLLERRAITRPLLIVDAGEHSDLGQTLAPQIGSLLISSQTQDTLGIYGLADGRFSHASLGQFELVGPDIPEVRDADQLVRWFIRHNGSPTTAS
ncbi:MAG: hypothetical protein CMH52_05060 [Myxococcales bacterium]|nr:hypothetical protein [Myxococcales bacterium]